MFNTLPIHAPLNRFISKAGLASIAVLAAIINGCGRASPQIMPENSARVEVQELAIPAEKQDLPAFFVSIDLENPTNALDFGRVIGPDTDPKTQSVRRAKAWTPATEGFSFVERAGRLYGVCDDGAVFEKMAFYVTLPRARISSDYLPGYTLDGGPGDAAHQVLYTGHFWPFSDYGNRMPVSFTFKPRAGRVVSGPEKSAPVLADWQSPFDNPTFVLFSADPPASAGSIAIVRSGALPQWITDDAEILALNAAETLRQRFDRDLTVKPTLFLARDGVAGGDESTFRFAGDALPAQIMAVIGGTPWAQRSRTGEEVLKRALVHEIVHLWQSSIRPANSDVPAWIHEGAAEAIAAETLVAMGQWTPVEKLSFSVKARTDCTNGIRNKRLDGLTKARNFRTVYACGHVMAELAARQPGAPSDAPVTDFWRDYMASAIAQNPEQASYSFATWLDFTEKRTGNREFAQGLKAFVRTKWSVPGAQIDALAAMSSPQVINPAR